jgi:hypothetical protein
MSTIIHIGQLPIIIETDIEISGKSGMCVREAICCNGFEIATTPIMYDVWRLITEQN